MVKPNEKNLTQILDDVEHYALTNQVSSTESDGFMSTYLKKPINRTIGNVMIGLMGLTGLGAAKHAIDSYKPNPSGYAQAAEASIYKGYGKMNVPDVSEGSGWKYLGERAIDTTDKIPGHETLVKGYEKGNLRLMIASYKGRKNPKSFWFFDKKTKKTFDTYTDTDNDGYFETHVVKGKSNNDYNHKKWGFK